MTNCMKVFENKKDYIELFFEIHYQNKMPYGVYIVRHYKKYNDLITYPEKEYTTADRKKALAAFNRYKRGV